MKKILFLVLIFVAMTATAGKRVLFIGDSITDGGWGNSGGQAMASNDRNHNDMNHIYGHSYMMLCAAHYQSEYPDSDFVFFNRGIGGNSLFDMAARWKEDCIDLQPDVVSILVGTNDVHYFVDRKRENPNEEFDIKGWEAKYRALLDTLKQSNPKVKILLGAPFVEHEGWVGRDPMFSVRDSVVRECAKVVEKIAKDYNAIYLPYNDMFDGLVKTEPRPSYWIWDGIHPTPAGHRRMADMWITTADKEGLLK